MSFYIVPTPIGNLKDFSSRSIDILKNSHIILCEKKERALKLLNYFQIKPTLLIAYHDDKCEKIAPQVIKELQNKRDVSLISDAGTPTISDPGNILVKECINNKINLIPIPGPSAPTVALSISGFSNKYYFYGFFPENNSEINKNFEILSKINDSIVFFISAKKFNRSISVIKKYFSDRKILICKEITKYFEEYFRLNVSELDQKNISLKGEITLVLSEKKIVNKTSNNLSESDKTKIGKLIKKLSIKEIVDLIKDGKNIPKKEIYNYCLKIKNEK